MQQCVYFSLIWLFLSIFESTAINFNVGEFNNDYAVYMRYNQPPKTRLLLNLIQQNGNIGITVNPRYQDAYDSIGRACQNALVLNNLVSGKWQTEIRPEGFLFDNTTSMVIVPETSSYRIFFDFGGSQSQNYTFPYRNGHRPSLVTRVSEDRGGVCSSKRPTVFEVSLGYSVPSFATGTAIFVRGTAPSTGEMFIDLSLGLPQQRDNLPVPLRIKATFGNIQQILLQKVVEGVTTTIKTVPNPIPKGGKFTISIFVQKYAYLVAVNCHVIGAVTSTITPYSQATVWASGMTAVEKIETF